MKRSGGLVRATALVAATLVSGCASSPQIWLRANTTEAQFNMDKYACAAQAEGSIGIIDVTEVIAANMKQQRVFEYCMRGKGYRPADESDKDGPYVCRGGVMCDEPDD